MKIFSSRLPTILFFIALVLPPLLYLSYLNRGYELDDALIYQRYIANLLAGHGLVYNPGEVFNGLTSPLFTYLLAAVAATGIPLQTAAIGLSVLFMALGAAVFSTLFSRYIQPLFAVSGAVFLVCIPFFYTTYGMETPLLVLLLGVCLLLFETQRTAWLGIVFALLILTRSEAVFLIAGLAVQHFREKRPFPPWRYFVLPLLLVAAAYVFNKIHYDAFLPHTGSAKIYQGNSGLWGPFLDLNYHLKVYFENNPWLLGGWVGMAGLGVLWLRLQSINVIIMVFLGIYTAFYAILNIPGYHWYYAPYYVFGCFYVAAGLYALFRLFFQNRGRLLVTLGGIAAAGAMVTTAVYSFSQTRDHFLLGAVNKNYREIADWLRHHTPPEAKVATVEVGTIGYYSQRHIIDILGLVSPLNARFIGEKNLEKWLHHHEPDYVLVHEPLWRFEKGISAAFLTGDYIDAPGFAKPKFRLLQNRRRAETALVWPVKIQADTATTFSLAALEEDGHYVIMLKPPGSIHFPLTAGSYRLSAEFGLLKRTYAAENPYPTDGVTFQVMLRTSAGLETPLQTHRLQPAGNPAHQGIQSLQLNFEAESGAKLILQTLSEEHRHSDWPFWRHVQLRTAAATPGTDHPLSIPTHFNIGTLQSLPDKTVQPIQFDIHNPSHTLTGLRRSGSLDKRRTVAKRIILSGWTDIPDSASGTLYVGVPELPLSVEHLAVYRPDVAKALANPRLRHSGFEISLIYDEATEVETLLAGICIAYQSPRIPMTVLNNVNAACVELP